jgi:hypothetical protein
VGDWEMQWRDFGEKHFGLLIELLKASMESITVDASDIQWLIDALSEFIPSEE